MRRIFIRRRPSARVRLKELEGQVETEVTFQTRLVGINSLPKINLQFFLSLLICNFKLKCDTFHRSLAFAKILKLYILALPISVFK